ncbi:MAG: hypothetical protein IPK99_15085 [Flavobacteriales bacterium]|nr:hypothetical protein [Flavobacteriales bacterium]
MNTTTDKPLIETLIATVQRTSPDLVEVRFKPGAVLTIPGIPPFSMRVKNWAASDPIVRSSYFPRKRRTSICP